MAKYTIEEIKTTPTPNELVKKLNELINFLNTYVTVWGSLTGSISDQEDLQSALDLKANLAALTSHTSSTSNPHNVTAIQTGAVAVNQGVEQAGKYLKISDLGIVTPTDLSASVTWENITGDINKNAALKSALDGKLDLTGGVLTGTLGIKESTTTSGQCTFQYDASEKSLDLVFA